MAAGFKVFQALLKVLPLIEEELVGGFVHGLLDVLEVKAQIVALATTRLLAGTFFNFQRLLILPIAERARGVTPGDGDFSDGRNQHTCGAFAISSGRPERHTSER